MLFENPGDVITTHGIPLIWATSSKTERTQTLAWVSFPPVSLPSQQLSSFKQASFVKKHFGRNPDRPTGNPTDAHGMQVVEGIQRHHASLGSTVRFNL